MTKKNQIKFFTEYDKSYTHSFASGIQLSSVNPGRFDLSFHYEKAHLNKEDFIATLTDEGQLQETAEDSKILEIDRLIKTAVSIDRETAESLVELLQEQLAK